MTKKTDNEREVNLLDYWNVVWSRRRMVISFFAAGTVLAAVLSLFIPNTYRAKAVITPVSSRESGVEGKLSSLAQQFGGLPGLSLPDSGSSAEIVSLLNSNILRKKVLEREGSMRLLFPERWDAERNAWESRARGPFSLGPSALAGESAGAQDDDAPTVWEGIRELLDIVSVAPNSKENTITVTVDASTPEASALMVESFLDTLTEHMSGEAQRVARINRKYLEEQLWAAKDPIIRQKIYNLIARQIETDMMAEVKENFAFKVIDPPMAPDRRISPRVLRMVETGMAASLFAGVCAAFMLDLASRQRRMKAPDESAREKSKSIRPDGG